MNGKESNYMRQLDGLRALCVAAVASLRETFEQLETSFPVSIRQTRMNRNEV